MKPKLIVFDFSATLAYLKQPNRKHFFSYLENFGIKIKTKKDVKSFYLFFPHILGFTENWREFSKKLLKKYIKKPSKKIIKELASYLEKSIVFKLYPDVKEIINLPIKKAILSNNAKFLMKELSFKKIKIFTPKETKTLKPNKKAFLKVLNYFKMKSEDVLMIGDEIEKDLIPAEELGITTILIDRKNSIKNYSGIKIKSLKELKKLI